jgi:hypothetical protein
MEEQFVDSKDFSESLIKLRMEQAKKPYSHRDKGQNTPEFNAKAKKRREKAKFAKKSRKRNQGK